MVPVATHTKKYYKVLRLFAFLGFLKAWELHFQPHWRMKNWYQKARKSKGISTKLQHILHKCRENLTNQQPLRYATNTDNTKGTGPWHSPHTKKKGKWLAIILNRILKHCGWVGNISILILIMGLENITPSYEISN